MALRWFRTTSGEEGGNNGHPANEVHTDSLLSLENPKKHLAFLRRIVPKAQSGARNQLSIR
jgi:hypothetical protein